MTLLGTGITGALTLFGSQRGSSTKISNAEQHPLDVLCRSSSESQHGEAGTGVRLTFAHSRHLQFNNDRTRRLASVRGMERGICILSLKDSNFPRRKLHGESFASCVAPFLSDNTPTESPQAHRFVERLASYRNRRRQAAARIQGLARGRSGRRKARTQRAERNMHHCARKIQRTAVTWMGRRRAKRRRILRRLGACASCCARQPEVFFEGTEQVTRTIWGDGTPSLLLFSLMTRPSSVELPRSLPRSPGADVSKLYPEH